MNAKFRIFVSVLATALFGACSSVENITPEAVPVNPSRTYTLSMKVDLNDGDVKSKSFKPYIVIDAQVHPMRYVGDGVYQYDYVMPQGRTSAKYYFQFDYDLNKVASKMPTARTLKSSQVYELNTESKYVVNMESTRGNVGSKITLLGRGFTQDDSVLVGGVAARTEYISDSTLIFVIPAVESGKMHKVELASADKKIPVGDFRVDDAVMLVSPTALELRSGESATLTFDIGFKAPAQGYVIDVKTNVPSSIIMDDVVVPAGSRTVNVPVKAGARGNGSLFVNGFGFKEVVIPITVK